MKKVLKSALFKYSFWLLVKQLTGSDKSTFVLFSILMFYFDSSGSFFCDIVFFAMVQPFFVKKYYSFQRAGIEIIEININLTLNVRVRSSVTTECN